MTQRTWYIDEMNEEEKEDYGMNDEYNCRSGFVIVDNGVRTVQVDGGEPEDNSFGRDWSWVEGALEAAYAAGLRDAKEISK